jgi:hypothetical protein
LDFDNGTHIMKNQNCHIIVGSGGTTNGNNTSPYTGGSGNDSSFGSLTALGGGGGGGNGNGANGGSGGGGANSGAGGTAQQPGSGSGGYGRNGSGTANTGGGGGGNWGYSAGAGGSGVVIVSYPVSFGTGVVMNASQAFTSAPGNFSSMSVNGTFLTLTFTGASGQAYDILRSTNLSLPLSLWATQSSGTFGKGPVDFTNNSATYPQLFYRLKSP